jgi:hypothetical protein
MKTMFVTGVVLLAMLLTVSSTLLAHHGSAAYDNNKLVVLKQGVVTKVNWANPHILILFDVKDDRGNVAHWVVEGGSPSAVSMQGWTNTTVQAGDTITAYLYQLRNGRPVGRLGKLVLANGRTLGDGKLTGDNPVDCSQESVNGGNEAAACRPDGRKTNNTEFK